MRKSTFMFSSWLVLSVILLQSQAVFSADTNASLRADIANGQTIYNEGKGNATACISCHGEKGQGVELMEAPRLANIGQIYILKQIADYSNDKRKDGGADALMPDIAKGLNPQDSLDVAAYLDSIEYEMEPSDLKALAADGVKVGDPKNGKIIMSKGIKPKVPACRNCHGFSGRAPNIGAIHQQKYTYLVNQLNRYRDGSRNNDQKVGKSGIMRGIAKNLTNENIMDIAAYLSTVDPMAP